MMSLFQKLFSRSRRIISSSGRTDTGRVRSNNEDDYRIFPDRNLFLVADGMGGHNAGEVASQVAVETLNQYCSKETIRKIKGNKEEISHFLIRGFHHTNEVVINMASDDASKSGMGCTLVGCLIDGEFLHTCHVGDVRCYVSNTRDFEQLTKDHSVIAEYEEKILAGDISELKRPPRQAITRAIGFPFQEDPEYHCKKIQPGSRLLLCSDGLWSMVDDRQIHDVIVSAKTPDQASEMLIHKANEAGGTDNITAVVIFC